MRKRIFSSAQDSEELHINLTPLIDVVFVVLIIFIIIAPMLEVDNIELAAAAHSPVKEMANVQESSPLAIHVHADNTIWFQQKKVTCDQLFLLLKEAKKHYPQKTPQLFHDKKASFGTYQNIKNTLELAGFETLDIILTPG